MNVAVERTWSVHSAQVAAMFLAQAHSFSLAHAASIVCTTQLQQNRTRKCLSLQIGEGISFVTIAPL